MEQRKTRGEMLDDLVAGGAITADHADAIDTAPVWSFSIKELVSYLASLIIAVGVVRILAVAFEDASETAISIALYVLSVALGVAAWKTSSGSIVRRRFSEVLEMGSLGSFVGASAVALSQTSIDGGWIGVMLSSVAILWGGLRCTRTMFVGTAALVVGVPALGGSLGSLTDSDSAWVMSLFNLVPGVVLLWLSMQRIGANLLASAAGSLFYVIGTIPLGADFSYGKPVPIVLGAALFALGSWRLAPEMLVAGSILVVVGVVMTVVRWVSNDIAQGLVIIATGLAVLGVLSWQMRRAVNRPKVTRPGLGTPTA